MAKFWVKRVRRRASKDGGLLDEGYVLCRSGDHPLSVGILLSIVILVGIVSLPSIPYPGDPNAWRAEAESLLTRGEISIPGSIALAAPEPGQYFVLNPKNGRYYSKYGTINGVLNVVPLLIGKFLGDEVLGLGVFFVVLSAIIAFLLYDLSGYYSKVEWVRVAFVILCFYTTFAWNYLRCTNSESTQWLFFLLAARSLLRLNRKPAEEAGRIRTISAVWFWTGCLCLTKVSWVLFIPLVAGALAYLAWKRNPGPVWAALSWKTVVFPAAVVCCVFAVNNWLKYGSPWLSGYHQWADPGARANFVGAAYELTLSPQWSLLIYFPPVVLAIPFWKRFRREHKEEAAFVLLVFLAFLCLYILHGNWRGEWAYGPRYFLFILPLLGLPAIYPIEWAARGFRRPGAQLALGLIFACGVFFISVQWQVNRLDWFFRYWVEGDLASLNDPQLQEYFNHTHFAKINWDYWRARNDPTKIPYYDRIRGGLSEAELKVFLREVRSLLLHPNLYWWSG